VDTDVLFCLVTRLRRGLGCQYPDRMANRDIVQQGHDKVRGFWGPSAAIWQVGGMRVRRAGPDNTDTSNLSGGRLIRLAGNAA